MDTLFQAFLGVEPGQQVGRGHHTEWWVPAEELEQLNDEILGAIEIVAKFPADAG